MSLIGKKKVLHSQAREIVCNAYDYMRQIFPTESITQIKERVFQCTKAPVRTIERILQQRRILLNNNAELVVRSPKKRHRKCTVTNLEDYELEDFRNIIYNFHLTEGCRVTAEHLNAKLKSDLGWKGSTSSLRRILKKIGFKWRTTPDNRKILTESTEIRLLRLKYLEKIRQYRRDGRNIVYLDETYIHAGHTSSKCWTDGSLKGLFANISKGKRLIIVHAGGEMGFVPNALLIFKSGCKSGDYHDDMNSENYGRWLTQQLIPNLPPNSVVVTDNASYHNVQLDRVPTSASRKSEMINWLLRKNIPFDPNSYKIQLYEIIKRHKKQHITYKYDVLLEQYGHNVLRLPPYHPDLNPIEKIWGIVKNNVAKRNITFKLDAAKILAEKEFADNKFNEMWKNVYNHVKIIEENYLSNERQLDITVPELIINLNEDSTSDDDSDFEFGLINE